MEYHNPVLLKECIENLNIKPDGVYVDLTFGGGGHSKAILQKLNANGKLFAFDQDEDAAQNAFQDDQFRSSIAIEIRHMQRTEVLEAEEFFSPGQKGSSAMPHKRNPVLTENLTGLARLVRMSVVPALENVALWHERDISHSSVERAIGPDTTVTLDFALNRLAGVIEKLVIYPENMLRNLHKFKGLVMSQRVLLALTQAGVSREDAYRLVQRNAMKVWEKGADFKTELLADPEVTAALPPAEIEEKFDLGYHTKHVDTIYARVFGPER